MKTQNDIITLDNGLQLRELQPHEITVQRSVTISALITCVNDYGLTSERLGESLDMLAAYINDQTGEHFKHESGRPLTLAERMTAANRVIDYMKAAKAFTLNDAFLLQIALCFYVIDDKEQITDTPTKFFNAKKDAILADKEAYVFFCIFGAKKLPRYRNLEEAQILTYLSTCEAVRLMTQPPHHQ